MQVAQLILLPTLLGKIDSIYQANLIKEIYHKNDNEDWKNILKIYEMNYEVVYNPLTFGPLLSPGLGGAGVGLGKQNWELTCATAAGSHL